MLAAALAFGARRAHALTRGGAQAAFAVGALTYGAGGLRFTAILLAFFLPSVGLSRLGRARKRALVDIGKSGPRDARQVLANGGAATACAILFWRTREPRWAHAFAGAYAAATADTWATEIGTLAKGRPRSILGLRPVATGMSGGITLAGTAAEAAGAGWLAWVAWNALAAETGRARRTLLHPLAAVAVAGLAGATLDSILGGGLQELRRCPRCERNCETDPHACGTPTQLVRGMRGVSNDAVNFIATSGAAAIAFALG